MDDPGVPPGGPDPARPTDGGDVAPAPGKPATGDPSEPSRAATAGAAGGDGQWVAFLLGVALLLALCVVLLLLASSRAPVGAAG